MATFARDKVRLQTEKYLGILQARGLPPIHFGKEDGVECTLLMGACQSETFLAPPWQGDADIRVLWHIGCQSEFAEGNFVHRNGLLAGREGLKYRFIR